MRVVKYILTVVLTALCLLCAGTCVYLMTQVLELRDERAQLESENTAKESAIAELRSSLEEEQDRSSSLESELDLYRETLTTQNEEQAEDDSQTGSQGSQEAEITVLPGEENTEGTEASDLSSLVPGDVISGVSSGDDVSAYFTSAVISVGDEVYARIYGKSYQDNDYISLEDLRYLMMLHYNFDHEVQVGEMIVHKNIAEEVLLIFQELFAAEYEIQSMFLIDNYWTGDADSTDTASIEENNTSCFNYREITGGGSLSNHAYGCAIDINPQQNPYIWYDSDGSLHYAHANAAAYIDRTSGADHMILYGDICYNTFAKYKFSWGGNWSNPVDYQHFEIVAY